DEISSKIEGMAKIDECIVIDDVDSGNNILLKCYYISKSQIEPENIINYLSDILPSYMIPTFFQQIKKIPLTINGKVNRKLLPEVNLKRKKYEDLKQPIDEVEKIILEVWKMVLNLNEIGVEENFFELGGDSIKAIQIVSNLRNKGIKLKVKDILTHLNIRNCRTVVSIDTTEQKSNEPLKGEKRLLPIDKWFFHNNFVNNNYYNQSVLIKFKDEISILSVEKTMKRLISYHDGLRLNYDPVKHTMFYNNKSLLDNNIFVSEEIVKENDFDKEISKIKKKYGSQFDITNGLLIKAVIIKCEKNDYLLFVAHHLIIDGVSWRIFLEDFENTYSNVIDNDKIYNLPSKSNSMTEWANLLYKLTDSSGILEQVDYWNEIENNKFNIPVDLLTDDMSTINLGVENIEIDEEKTKYLKNKLFRKHNISIEEFLLLVVSRSIKSWLSQDEVVIYMENHGRDNENIDLTRTIGWFTNIYPISLDMKSQELKKQIKNIKMSLSSIPDKGMGYGLLKYIRNKMLNKGKIQELRFNYLGQYNGANNGLFEYVADNFQSDVSEDNDLTTKIEIESIILDNKLKIIIKFNKLSFLSSTVELFKDEIERNINDIFSFLNGTNEKFITTSDFKTIELEEEEFESLFE
ncbi:MAG: hypothetical protein GQ534_03515, partial [Candidatus Delongbacteria bacterium]|nr:hypothetical protein [Candidatus Delongbacteria bacterium]